MSTLFSQAESDHVVEPKPAAAPPAREASPLAASLRRAVKALFSKQHADGHFCAELEGDSILITEYLLMKVILGHDVAPHASADDLRRFPKMLTYLRRLQREDGGWGQYPGSQVDLSATVKAYLTLKLFGEDPETPHMTRARDLILSMGGAERINTFSMFYLACLGQVTWNACPIIPPEVALLPRWFPFHLDKVAAWTRTMILPLAICTALRPARSIPERFRVDELFLNPARKNKLCKAWNASNPFDLANVFILVDRAVKIAQRLGLFVLTRKRALRVAEAWLLERMDGATTDGLGAIFPPMVYIQVAFQAMGYPRTHPVIKRAEHELDRFIVEEDDHVRIQPCFSPVWDSGIALYALTEAGLTEANDARVRRCCNWLREHEVKMTGDWVRNLRPQDRHLRLGDNAAAWAFEYRNDWYPDVDDTAMVAKALRRAGDGADEPYSSGASHSARATRWLLAMQNDDGGWAAFDRTKHRGWMEKVPFADHNAMQDPSCADITGRTIESLITCGVPPTHPAIIRAINYLRRAQRGEGCWWGRWGCNFLYGTWQALGGLNAAGIPRDDPAVKNAIQWLRAAQNEDGGFGETADSYIDERLKGIGPSTPSQTAWGLMTLLYGVGAEDEAVRRAARWLMDNQLAEGAPAQGPMGIDAGKAGKEAVAGFLERVSTPALVSHPVAEPAGAWRESWFTGTGFPKVFYLRYHLYRHYFPIMALARLERERRRESVVR